jgi:hypothetical protein
MDQVNSEPRVRRGTFMGTVLVAFADGRRESSIKPTAWPTSSGTVPNTTATKFRHGSIHLNKSRRQAIPAAAEGARQAEGPTIRGEELSSRLAGGLVIGVTDLQNLLTHQRRGFPLHQHRPTYDAIKLERALGPTGAVTRMSFRDSAA